jgi:predicted phage terminase large subunit-like protein
MTAVEPDWNKVLEFFEPKKPLFCPEEPSLPQKAFLRYQGMEALYGGAAGGGKSSALLMAALQYVDVPGYAAILFRRTYADLAQPGALMDRFKKWIGGQEEIRWNDSTYTATFPSGARITFGYLNNKDDYLRYKGVEVQFVGMDEVSEIRIKDYEYLFSRMRRPQTGPLSQVPLRMRCTSNPSPNWVRQHFIVEGKENGIVFFPAKLDDNPGVDAESYRAALDKLDPVERARLKDGNWWVTETGSMFRREDFIIIEPEDIGTSFSKDARACRFWDLAATKASEKNPDPDWTVGTLCVFDAGTLYVLDVRRIRNTPAKVEELVIQTAKEDGHVVAIRMEREPGSAGVTVADSYARFSLPGYDFAAIPSSGDKVTRSRPFSAAVANRNVRVIRSSWLTPWLDELSSFPEAGDHDDQVDSVVSCFNFLTGLAGPARKKLKIIV